MTTPPTHSPPRDLSLREGEVRVLHSALRRQYKVRLKDAASARSDHIRRMALEDLRLLKRVMTEAGMSDLPD